MIELNLEHSHSHEQPSPKVEEVSSEEEEQEVTPTRIPCHPHRPVQNFDFSAIQEQIRLIRVRKQAAREAARRAQKKAKNKQQIYETDIIEEALEQSQDLIPEHISMALKQRIRFIEDKAFISAQNNSVGQFVTRIKEQILPNESLANELNLVMSGVEASIQGDIEEGNYEIHNIVRKKKIIPIQPEPAHRVKLKNMLIKSKIVDLRDEMNKSEIISDSRINPSIDSSNRGAARQEGQVWGDQFHLLSEGTKKATEFVKKIRKQQEQMRKERVRKSKQIKSIEVKSAMEHKQFEQQMKKERHQTLKQRYLQGRQQKKVQKQKQEEREKEFLNFIKEYKGKKPLFKVKQQHYINNILGQRQKKQKMHLQAIHSARKSITKQDIAQHQKNYQKLKREKMQQLNSERQLRKKQEQNLPRKSYYRGRYHSVIKQEEEQRKNIPDPNITRDELLKKQKEFGQFVRKKYAPHVDEAKKKQLDELMKNLETQGGRKGLSEEEEKKLGNEYLKQMHKMIDEMRAKGLLQSRVEVKEGEKKKDYMKEVRDKYNFSTIDYSSQVDKNAEWVHNVALKREDDARKKEKLLKLHKQYEVDQYMKDLQDINDDYINSVEAKMSLINKIEGRTGRKSITSSRMSSQDDY